MSYRVLTTSAINNEPVVLASSRSFRPVNNGIIRTTCSLCQNFCGLFALVKDGKVLRVEGDPDNPRNHGHLCAKGLSGYLSLYSPKRITRPLLRTNPAKGLGVDPKWKEISWNEAIDIVANRIREVRRKLGVGQDDQDIVSWKGGSGKILITTFDHPAMYSGAHRAWAIALDAIMVVMGAACYCGNAVHPPSFLNTSTFEITPDAEYAKYLLLIGSQAGSIIHYDTMNVARHIAEKRPGNVKVVVVDPMCAYAAARSEEWIPIRPGTDGALIMSLINLMVNEYKIYDSDFLMEKTNAPYLVGEDGLYVRDDQNRPLIWDAVNGAPKAITDIATKNCALEGSYVVNGKACKPSFQLIKDHAKRYSPEMAAEITSIPEETIRRIAKELGEAACIGKTIVVDGMELPYRPVSVVWYRGISAHKHAYLTGFAAMMIPTLLGAIQVPGGISGHPPAKEETDVDGMMVSKAWLGSPYPPRPVKKPRRVDLYDLFPVGHGSSPLTIPVMLNPRAFGLEKEDIDMPEILITWRDNAVKNMFTPEIVAEAYSKIPFMVAFNMEPDETMQLADIVFPELHHLEKLAENVYLRVAEPGYWYAAKPATKPPFEPPWDRLVNIAQILLEIADRAGFLKQVYASVNRLWALEGTPYELNLNQKYRYDEIVDRRLKAWLGPELGVDWLLSAEGGLRVWKAKPEERWKGATRKGRIHLYYEFMVSAGRDLEKVVKQMGIPWETSDYQPIPDWKPCPSYVHRKGDYDLFAINYKVPIQAHGVGRLSPLLHQLVDSHGLDAALVHPETAARKNIQDGDEIWIETTKGRRVKSVVRLTERVHPEVIATLQHRLQKGADFNSLTSLDPDTMDFLSCSVDSCVLVKVYKADQAESSAKTQ